MILVLAVGLVIAAFVGYSYYSDLQVQRELENAC